MLGAEARISWPWSLRWLILVAHLASHLKSIVSDGLHTRLHHLLLIRHLKGTLRHTHLRTALPNHLHLLVVHLHIHSLNLDHVANLPVGIALALTVDAEALDATNWSLPHLVLHLHSLRSLAVGLHVVL